MKKIINLKLFMIGVSIFLIMTSVSMPAIAKSNYDENIVVLYSFTKPLIEKIDIDGVIYEQIVMKESPCGGNTGDPLLPSMGAYILLPQGQNVKNINVLHSEKVFLGSGYNIQPCGEYLPLSQVNTNSQLIMNEGVYCSDAALPKNLFTEIGTYSFRGYQILVLKLYPVEYIEDTGELYYYEDMTIQVETQEDKDCNSLFRGLPQDKIKVMNKVDNPEITNTYKAKNTKTLSGGRYDLLIITTDDLEADFEPLKEYHDAEGIRTEIRTLVTDIPVSYDIRRTCRYIRDYIRDAYNDSGIEYVLIGGDDNVVPAQDIHLAFWDGGPYYPRVACDIYYACLDGPWNYDGDDKWGESNDGENGGDVDLIAEVFVGRASVGNSKEIGYFIDKTITYIETSDNYLNKALMVGEYCGLGTYSGDYMDQLINGSDADGYTTVGISSTEYHVDTLYDRDWDEHDWPKTEVVNRINEGVHIINHAGHSAWDMNMKLYVDEYSLITNEKHCFIYSQGCAAGAFDISEIYGDCIAEYFTIKNEYGAFAGIWNARDGFWLPHGTDSPSQRYHREFWDAVFGENIPVISKANQDSKEDLLYRINEECMRMCYYELNLFGDPTLAFRSLVTIGDVAGGKEVSIEIKNVGDTVLTDIEYILSVKGGILGLINVSAEGTIETIEAGGIETVKITDRIFGLGRVEITVRANKVGGSSAEKKVNGFVLGPFVIVMEVN